MIICKACGRPNEEDAEFCADCGRYLAWNGEHVDASVEATPEEFIADVVPVHKPSFMHRVLEAVGLEQRTQHAATQSPVQMVPQDHKEPEAASELAAAEPAATAGMASRPASALDGGGSVASTTQTVQLPAVESIAPTPIVPVVPHLGHHHHGAQAPTTPSEPVPVTPGLARPDAAAAAPASPVARPMPNLRSPTEIEAARSRPISAPSSLLTAPGVDVQRPGDVICPVCAQFNTPSRTFCRRCGAELQVLMPLGPSPRYEELTFSQRHLHRRRRIAPAGARPGKWGKAASGGGGSNARMRFMARAGMAVCSVAILLSFIGTPGQKIRNWYTGVYHSIVNAISVSYIQEFAIGATASSSTPGHGAGLAVDDASNTYWMSLANLRRNGVGQRLTVTFAVPTKLDRIGFLSGITANQQGFLSQCRPQDVDIIYGTHTIHEHLQDTSSFQRLAVTIPPITKVTFIVRSVYVSATGHRVAITEIEFFQRT